jgi:hypothetical protein
MNVDAITLFINGVSICRCSACRVGRNARLLEAIRQKYSKPRSSGSAATKSNEAAGWILE